MPDGAAHQRRWDAWMQRTEMARQTPLFRSATRSLTTGDSVATPAAMEKFSGIAPPRKETALQPGSSDRSAIIGTLAHRVLHGWDFSADPGSMPAWIEDCCRMYLPTNMASEGVCAELQELFTHFVESEPYAILRQAEILGREIPFAVPWENKGADAEGTPSSVMEGVIDVMYRRGEQIWIADYKTHQVDEDSLETAVQAYRPQMEIYRRAVMSAWGNGPVRAQLIFLRSGLGVEV